MLVDKRVGWLRDLEVGSNVKVLSEGTEHLGQVTLITSLGVLLVRCADGSKFKIMPDGLGSNQDLELQPYGNLEEG